MNRNGFLSGQRWRGGGAERLREAGGIAVSLWTTKGERRVIVQQAYWVVLHLELEIKKVLCRGADQPPLVPRKGSGRLCPDLVFKNLADQLYAFFEWIQQVGCGIQLLGSRVTLNFSGLNAGG